MLGAIVEFGIPDLLTEGAQTASSLAARTNLKSNALYRVLRLLAQRGIFRQEADGTFALTPLSEQLCSNVENPLRTLLLAQVADWKWKSWAHLKQTLQTGKPGFEIEYGTRFYQYIATHPTLASSFNDSQAKRTEVLIEHILPAWDFSTARHLVEVGCGQGMLTARILQEYPQLEATALDLPCLLVRRTVHCRRPGTEWEPVRQQSPTHRPLLVGCVPY